ncbi:hypothetical protein HYT00_00305 [Candidatus Giovannonibacteria bacterium]|nr:hypothetical protein [Candidatus Giovannonibacteria bacterium]
MGAYPIVSKYYILLIIMAFKNFPETGASKENILDILENFAKKMKPYSMRGLRIYSTDPHPLAIEAITKFLPFNRNNIGTHTSNEYASGLQYLEAEVISMLSNLFGLEKGDGYLTQGGTEGNITGLWIGRNMLQENGGKLCLLKTPLTHYSIEKAADLLNINKVVDVPCDTEYGMDGEKLKETIKLLYQEGYNNFLIALTLGYSGTGTVDPLNEIDAVINDFQSKLKIKTYVHMDAAIGGLVYPFVSEKILDFRYSSLQSISLDMHKTGLVPHNAGVFLCRKGLQNFIERPVPYLGLGKDNTLSGSRPAAIAAGCWSIIMLLGKSGFKKIVESELNLKKYFIEASMANEYLPPFIFITHPSINILAFHINKLKNSQLDPQTEKRFGLKPCWLLHDGEKKLFYTIIFMPHITKKIIDEFFASLKWYKK